MINNTQSQFLSKIFVNLESSRAQDMPSFEQQLLKSVGAGVKNEQNSAPTQCNAMTLLTALYATWLAYHKIMFARHKSCCLVRIRAAYYLKLVLFRRPSLLNPVRCCWEQLSRGMDPGDGYDTFRAFAFSFSLTTASAKETSNSLLVV